MINNNNKIYTRKMVEREKNEGGKGGWRERGRGCATKQWGKSRGEEERPCREREINPSPPPEEAGLSLRHPAGAKGETVPGRRSAGGTGACCRAGAGAEPQPRAPAQHRNECPRFRGSGSPAPRPAWVEASERRNALERKI